MVRVLLLVPLILLGLLPLLGQQPVVKGKRYAILIGVNKYIKRGPYFEKPLQFAERDMTELNAILSQDGFQVTMMLGSADGENEATRENIYRVLIDKTKSVLRNVTGEDTVLVAFAGHGEQIRFPELDADGKPKKNAEGEEVIKEEIPYFLPKDAISQDPDTQISINEVLDALAKRGGGNNIVLVDACRTVFTRAEPSRRGATMDRGKVQALGQGFSVMFACSDRQTAVESEKADGGHGLFFCSVIDALKKTQPNRKGQVTWGQLFPVITERLEELTEKIDVTTPKERQQVPQAINNIIGDPVFLTKPYVARVPKPINGGEQQQDFGELFEEFEWKGRTKTRVVRTANLGGEKVEFVRVPAGDFLMGSDPEKDKDAQKDEQPQHKVTFSKPLWVAKYPVTKGQFAAFVKAEGYITTAERAKEGGSGFDGKAFASSKDFNWKNTGWPQTDRHPVVNVSFDDAAAYCSWASKQVKRTVRLLSEAEYEYANRGSSSTLYFTGDNAASLKNYANVGDAALKAKSIESRNRFSYFEFDDNEPFTAQVGKYSPNGFGLYDMTGNVFSWCTDWYDDKLYAGRKGGIIDPKPNWFSASRYRVLRGGSWEGNPPVCRVADRIKFDPDTVSDFLGFRVCMTLD